MSGILENVTYAAIVLLLLYIVNKAYALYSKRKHYPNGDFPLPVFGNILSLALNLHRNPCHYFAKRAQKYGDVYTFWFGSEPLIMINDYDLAKRLLNKTEFSDRFDESVIHDFHDIMMENSMAPMNYDSEQKVLRKVSIEAVRRYLLTNKLSVIVREIVNETVHEMMERERGKEFIPFQYIDSIFMRLLVRTNFGEKVSFGSKLINQLLEYMDVMQSSFLKIAVSKYFPVLNLLHNKSEQQTVTMETNEVMRDWYRNSLQSYHSESTESLSHLLNSTKLRFLSVKQNKMYEKYLCENNIIGILFTLLVAGSDTSHYTLKWMLLLMACYPEMQRTMRDEIKLKIGDKHPDLCDTEQCDYLNAFVCETLRFRNVFPTVFHRTQCQTSIGNKEIPKGIGIISNQHFMLNDPKYWTDPQMFNPQRFLNSVNCFDKTLLPAFIPFSTGKRMCVGDKFAMNALVLTLTCLLQATNGYQYSLANPQTIDLEPKTFGYFLEPKPYKILIKKD